MNIEFWEYVQDLVDGSGIVIDRPKGSEHPRYAGKIYPVDYGCLKGTTSIDKGGVDIWVGSRNGRHVVGVLCTVDLLKRDAELKILLECTDDEIQAIEKFANDEKMRAITIKRVTE